MTVDRRFEAAKAALQGIRTNTCDRCGAAGMRSHEVARWAIADADALLAELARTERHDAVAHVAQYVAEIDRLRAERDTYEKRTHSLARERREYLDQRDEARALVRRFYQHEIPLAPDGAPVIHDARDAIARWDTEGKP